MRNPITASLAYRMKQPAYTITVREPLKRGLRFGSHGLPLIGTGDWNDGMNKVGEASRGESVWMGFPCTKS